jgi:putative tricarboxylic transport membrane protein
VVLAVGLFAVGEALYVAAYQSRLAGTLEKVKGSLLMSASDWRRSWPAWLRGTAFGFPIGALPAGGAEIPTFLSYATERRLSRHPEQFGRGAIEGVAGPEAANNAAAAGVLVPLLTIGLPTSATAAVILTAFQSYGLQPGPQLFSESGPLVYALLASLYVGNVMLLVLNLPLIPLWVKVLKVPYALLGPFILVVCVIAAYGVRSNVFDVWVMLAFGAVGYFMRKLRFPMIPLVIALILGDKMENALRQSLTLADGSLAIFVTRPIAATFLLVAVAGVAWSLYARHKSRLLREALAE